MAQTTHHALFRSILSSRHCSFPRPPRGPDRTESSLSCSVIGLHGCWFRWCSDAHRILLYTENNYFCFFMHSSSLYSIFMNWLYKRPRIHKYYTSSVWCHSTLRLEPVSLTLKTSLRLRQIKLDNSSSHEYCHVTFCMQSHALHKDISVYVKPVIVTQLNMVKFIRWNSWSPTCKDEAEILTPREVVFKCYALHSKQIPYIQVSEDIIRLALH